MGTIRKRKTSDALEILYHRFYRNSPERRESVRQESRNMGIAQMIYFLRTRAGLTQKELADRIGTHASAISRLEDADYGGQSLPMLKRIATEFGFQLHIRLVPVTKARTSGPARKGKVKSGKLQEAIL